MKLIDVTPNLLVRDLDKSTAFYRDVLGFSVVATVPEHSPFVFVWMQRDGVNVFLNDAASAGQEYPTLRGKAIGGSLTIYITLSGVDEYFKIVSPRAAIEAPLETKPYGMREFAVVDPDGYVLTFAEEVGERDRLTG
jgi:lactoylglutathione lyase